MFRSSTNPSIIFAASLALLSLSRSITKHNPLPLLCNAQLYPGDPEEQDYYCGWDWEEANDFCEFHCPSGLDEDCPPLPNGRNRRCIAAAGCFSRKEKLYWTGLISLSFDADAHLARDDVTSSPAAGSTEGETTYYDEADPAAELMTDEEAEAFEESFENSLNEAFKDQQIQISGVTLQDQEYNRPCVAAVAGGDDSDSTSLDTVVRVAAEYIPIGDNVFTDDTFGEAVLGTVNSYSHAESFVNSLQGSSPFFGALTGISAIEEDSVAEAPSSMPSGSPTRGFDQVLDIRIESRPSGSYGIVFNMRTPREGQTILLTGMSFLTLYDGLLEYEVYSRLGSYEKYIGKDDYWELVASGQTTGRGAKEYTHVLEEGATIRDGDTTLKYVGFEPLHVPGDRGQRSFYVAITNRFTNPDGSAIPLLFSSPKGLDAEGGSAYEIVDSTPELEIYEGDGVLDWPWPKDRDGPYYRRPRGYIGSFDYEMYPCHPILNFTGWPCPYQRQTKRPTTKLTERPTDAPITKGPTKNPTKVPTENPVVQIASLETDGETGFNGTDAPGLASGPGGEANNNNDKTVTVGVEEEGMNNGGAIGSWKAAYSSCGGLALLVLYFSY